MSVFHFFITLGFLRYRFG